MATNPNMKAIETVTVPSGGASSITFSNIPQTYTDLVIKGSTRLNGGDEGVQLVVRFNDSQSGYSRRSLEGNGSTASSHSGSSETYMRFAYAEESVYTANTFNNFELYIPNYTSSNNKSTSSYSVVENNATIAYPAFHVGLWANSAPITSISIFDISSVFAPFVQYSTATLYGITSASYGATKATGGVISETDTHWIHSFYATGTFTPTQNLTADYLVVAGGGSGGNAVDGVISSGGGGAGGLRSTVTATGGGGSLESAISLNSGTTYTITVGGGGSGTGGGSNGVNSSIAGTGITTVTSTGGGRGAGNTLGNGASGGSGGGGANVAGKDLAGSGTPYQGYDGGNGLSSAYATGGGGGAGQVGSGTGLGGNGISTSISGSSVAYGGGGGGGGSGSNSATGGGGQAGNDPSGVAGNGSANTGGGGGGAQKTNNGGNGGSGIVIIRYAK